MKNAFFSGDSAMIFWMRYFVYRILFKCHHAHRPPEKGPVLRAMDAAARAGLGYHEVESLVEAIDKYMEEVHALEGENSPHLVAEYDNFAASLVLRWRGQFTRGRLIEIRLRNDRGCFPDGIAQVTFAYGYKRPDEGEEWRELKEKNSSNFLSLPELLDPARWAAEEAKWEVSTSAPRA